MSWAGWIAIAIGGLLAFGIFVMGILIGVDILNERRAHYRKERQNGNRTADR